MSSKRVKCVVSKLALYEFVMLVSCAHLLHIGL
jgi:hypothetical protein